MLAALSSEHRKLTGGSLSFTAQQCGEWSPGGGGGMLVMGVEPGERLLVMGVEPEGGMRVMGVPLVTESMSSF